MIRLIPDPTFEHEVGIVVPGAEEPVATMFVFRAHDLKRALSLLKVSGMTGANFFVRQWHYLKLCRRTRSVATVIEMLDELIVSWEGFDLPYSKDALRRLLSEYPDARASIFFAYFSGLQEARLKN